MPPSLKQQLDICEAALALSPAVRTTFLKRYCGRDVELLRKLESLICAIQRADPFMEPIEQTNARLNINNKQKRRASPTNNPPRAVISDTEDSDQHD